MRVGCDCDWNITIQYKFYSLMSEEENRTVYDSIEQNHIAFDKQLLQKKKKMVEEFMRNEQDSQDVFMAYPNQILEKLAESQVKQFGKLIFYKSTTTIYFGQVCNDLYHGYGLLLYKSNVTRFYQGYFQNNCKYGYGLQYINGDLYIGKFVNNKPEDQNGIFIWANQDMYHGCFVNGMKHGTGKWQSGNQFYSGSWKFNKPEGMGYIKSGLSQYSGEVKNGYKHGKGLELFSNGDRYQGSYSNGKPEGNGTYSWSNGSIYKGQFKNGLRFGYGIWQFGAQKYQGTYINDKRNGEGMYIWGGGSHYNGTFVEDLRHGFGQMHWQEGSYYKGEWIEGMQHGEGEVWDKGKMIEKGYYENGKIKINAIHQDSERRLLPDANFNKKLVTQKNHMFPPFEPKKRFNSFHGSNTNQSGKFDKSINNRTSNHLDYLKKNEHILQKKRQINKRYSALDRIADKKSNNLHNNEHTQRKSIDPKIPIKKQDKSKEKTFFGRTSVNKIGLYKKLRKERQSQAMTKKIAISKLPLSSQNDVSLFQTQLAPIKWKNFNHVIHS